MDNNPYLEFLYERKSDLEKEISKLESIACQNKEEILSNLKTSLKEVEDEILLTSDEADLD